MDHFAVVEAHDPPGMVPMMKSTNDSQMGFSGHILVLKILIKHQHPSKLARETILSVGEWYWDHFAVVEVHDPPGMVPMIKSTNYGQNGQGQQGVPRPYFDVENPGTKSTGVKIEWRNHSLSKRMVYGPFCSG